MEEVDISKRAEQIFLFFSLVGLGSSQNCSIRTNYKEHEKKINGRTHWRAQQKGKSPLSKDPWRVAAMPKCNCSLSPLSSHRNQSHAGRTCPVVVIIVTFQFSRRGALSLLPLAFTATRCMYQVRNRCVFLCMLCNWQAWISFACFVYLHFKQQSPRIAIRATTYWGSFGFKKPLVRLVWFDNFNWDFERFSSEASGWIWY